MQLNSDAAPVSQLAVRFFSYFTILTNILVAIYATNLLLDTSPQGKGFFSRRDTQTAVTLYIFIVGLIYNLLLRHLWTQGGLQAILNDVLHTVIPLAVIFYWWVWVDASGLRYKDVLKWLAYPVVYCLYTVAHGHYGNWYPYPFINVSKLGYPQAVVNALFILLAFYLFGCLLILLGKIKTRKVING